MQIIVYATVFFFVSLDLAIGRKIFEIKFMNFDFRIFLFLSDQIGYV